MYKQTGIKLIRKNIVQWKWKLNKKKRGKDKSKRETEQILM